MLHVTNRSNILVGIAWREAPLEMAPLVEGLGLTAPICTLQAKGAASYNSTTPLGNHETEKERIMASGQGTRIVGG